MERARHTESDTHTALEKPIITKQLGHSFQNNTVHCLSTLAAKCPLHANGKCLFQNSLCIITLIQPLNNGQVGDEHFVHCSEVVPSLEAGDKTVCPL